MRIFVLNVKIEVMTREDIEKAAKHYSSRDGGVTLQTEIYAFIEGAKWRIASIWHNASEQPEKSERYILIESISYDGIRCYNVVCAKHYEEHPFNERWAYIEDLLPTK